MKLVFRLLDHCLTIDDDSPARGDELERLFSGLERVAEPFEPVIEFRVRHIDGLDHVSQDGRFEVVVGPERLVSTLMQYLVYRWAESRTWMVVHGAQLVVDGRAIVLIGPSGAGKSTLSAMLSLRGFALGSDELVVLDGSGRCHPYPVPPRIRESSKTKLEAMGLEFWPRPVWMKDQWTYFGLPQTFAAPRPYPVAAVVFLSAGAGPVPELAVVSAGDAAIQILTEVLNHEPIEPAWFECAVQLSRTCRCVALRRGASEPTMNLLLEHLASEGLRP